MIKRIQAYYSGRVQGVGFRFSAERIANELGLCGRVKNLSNGKVQVVAEADERILKDFLRRLRDAFSHYIEDVAIEWLSASGEFKDFSIEF